jgi:hypothetical protein
MNLKRIGSRKSLKFLGLLISSLLIATVSATTFRYLYIDGSITVGTQQMSWILGSDASGASISGTTAIVNFNVEEGTPVNFTEALFLKNTNATGSFTYNITLLTNVLSGDFQKAQMHIYENYTAGPTWTYLDTIDLTNAADYYSNSLGAGNYTRMTFDINATIASGTKDFNVQVEYWAP